MMIIESKAIVGYSFILLPTLKLIDQYVKLTLLPTFKIIDRCIKLEFTCIQQLSMIIESKAIVGYSFDTSSQHCKNKPSPSFL